MTERHDATTAERRRHERGSVIVFVTIGLTALLGLAAWATETGRVWQAKNQLQAVADSASLAGVGNLFNSDFTAVDPTAATNAAIAIGPEHEALGTDVAIANADVATGSWDLTTRTFTPLPGSTDPDLVRAVRVRTRRTAAVNGTIPSILGRAVGHDEFSVSAESVALWGVAGGAGPGSVDLPIAIDCCQISGATPGAACSQNYCDTVQSTPPNPCPLSNGTMATCLEFYATPEQNACWTEFDGDTPSISTSGLGDIVDDGNEYPVDGPIFLDNGTKTPTISDIHDRFHGEGNFSGNGAGEDTDGDGMADSWVVRLPVVTCQNPGDQCASGEPQRVVGVVCFDIQEVLVRPEKIIKGTFLCSTDPRCDNPGLLPGGTLLGGIPASFPVIVN